MTIEYIGGLVLGVAVGLVLVWLLFTAVKRRDGGPVISFDFDERQRVARGRAFKYAFITQCGYFALYSLLAASWEKLPPVPVVCFAGILLSLTVFAVCCIFMDAYLSLTEKPKTIVAIVTGGAALNVVLGIVNTGIAWRESGSRINLGVGAVNLLCGAMLVVILISLVIKRAVDKRGGDE